MSRSSTESASRGSSWRRRCSPCGWSLGALVAAAACSGQGGPSAALVGACASPGAAGCEPECAGSECAAGSGGAAASGAAGEPRPGVSGGLGGFLLNGDLDPEPAPVPPEACVDLAVDFDRIIPTVVLLIDQSGSMTEPFGGGRSRWQTLVQTLTDPERSLLARLDSSVRFGMALYTSHGGFGGGDPPLECPILSTVDIALGNFSELAALLSDPLTRPDGDTPTAESLAAVAAQLAAVADEGPKSIILATDGDPDTCEDPNANNDEASKALSVAAVQAAFQSGISTRVISVGDDVTESHLEALAVAGAGDAAARAYQALDTSALEAAFNEVIAHVRTCDFELQGTVAPADAARGTVRVDGEELEFGAADGWTMPDERTVRLEGEACAAIQADASGISMSFPCDAIEIIPR